MRELDYDKPQTEIPLEYARALLKAAEAVNALYHNDTTVYGEAFVPDRLTFWDGNSNERSEWFIDVHDDDVWISLAGTKTEESV